MGEYEGISLEDCIGKTIKELNWTDVEGPYGDERAVTFVFTDNTYTTIVVAQDEDDGFDDMDPHKGSIFSEFRDKLGDDDEELDEEVKSE